MNCVSKCNNCTSGENVTDAHAILACELHTHPFGVCAAGQTDEMLTDLGAEDSIQAGLHNKAPHNNVVIESDGPESDRPETTASMGTYKFALKQSVQHCTQLTLSMMQRPWSSKVWRVGA